MIGNYLASPQSRFAIKSFIGLAFYTMLIGGIYILNQITDINTDRLNKKLFILSEKIMPLKNAYIEMFALWSISIILSYFFGKPFFIFMLISLILGIMYSLPPIKLKGKPFLDTLSNGFGYGMLNFAIGWLTQNPFEWRIFLKFLPYFLSISAVFVNTTIVDIEGDKKAGEKTTSVFLGEGASYILSTTLLLSGIFSSFINKDFICLVPSAISLPLFLYATIYYFKYKRMNRKLTILSFRLPGLIFTIITCLLYPAFIPVLILLLLAMRIYYKKRFNMVYPTLNHG